MAITEDQADKLRNAKSVQSALINTISKTVEKAVQEAKYDKTILATIQYCSDASIGQYKVKYQDGYYTAYAQDTSRQYFNNTLVYVKIPENNMSNRMFITGTATNDSSNKVYTRNLVGDQQYSPDGANLITYLRKNAADMCSYDAMNKEYQLTLWKYDSRFNNIMSVTRDVDKILAEAQYIRFGASFKTELAESRKASGDYGLILVLGYLDKDGNYFTKQYVLDTYHMNGSPFEFNTYMPQYNYWELDTDNESSTFYRLDSIIAYVKNFPYESDLPSVLPFDIFIKDISLHKAVKLYNSDDDTYKVSLVSPNNWTFTSGDVLTSNVEIEATLRVNGNTVMDETQNVKYYWAKEDGSIDSVNHCKYNSYFGKGWYCLNTATNTVYTDETLADLSDPEVYTVKSDDLVASNKGIEWHSMKTIKIPRNLCRGRKTRIKCIAVYENIPISSDIKEISNEGGYYLKLRQINNDTKEFYNGAGSYTLVAGVFQDNDGETPNTLKTLDAVYHWTEIDAMGYEKALPNDGATDYLPSYPDWDSEEDNENLTDVEIAPYLNQNPGFEICRQRYNYYLSKAQSYRVSEEEGDDELYTICNTRANNIIDMQIAKFANSYVLDENVNGNINGYPILGPSAVTGIYTDENKADYRSAEIDTTTQYFVGDNRYVAVYNTLYAQPARKISTHLTYRVTATLTEVINGKTYTGEIGTEYVTLINNAANLTDYNLQIINGKQTFMYSNSGAAPTIEAGSEHPVSIKPLSFRLFDRQGILIYDSEDPDNEDFNTNITELKPVWRFNDTNSSLIKTGYKGAQNTTVVNPDGVAALEVRNEARLVYTIADQFDVNKKESSNIVLEVNYQGMIITASTDFTFVKQGDLGTNGTDKIVEIEDTAYDLYKSLVLSQDRYATIVNLNKTTDSENPYYDYYYPPQRHLSNTYLFATMAYDLEDGSYVQSESIDSARYVNLQFATGSGSTEDDQINGSNTVNLTAYWNKQGTLEAIGNDSQWETEIVKGVSGSNEYYSTPSFKIVTDNGQGSSVQLKLWDPESGTVTPSSGIYLKPTWVEDFTPTDRQGESFERIANNIIKVKATQNIEVSNSAEQDEYRVGYGYYTMPFYYFNWTGATQMPGGVDPARHIVITGGFDQVVYNEKGIQPVYNQQEPFTFHMFDENGVDITKEVLDGAGNYSSILWSVSPGFTGQSSILTGNVKIFPDYFITPERRNEQLYGQYFMYQNELYKCITRHIYSQPAVIRNADSDIIQEYAAEQFVTPYWEKVSEEVMNAATAGAQVFEVKPAEVYNTVAQTGLFNSWVSLYVRYDKPNSDKVYEAMVLLPINVLCNKYGSDLINGWDGKKTKVNDAYIMSSQIAAGEKEEDNTFTGITIGKTFYPDDSTKHAEIGLFGYGHTLPKDNVGYEQSWRRTLFMDANTGRTILGASGSAQIVLNPDATDQNGGWSRLAGWYFNKDYLYKPIGENANTDTDNVRFTKLSQGDAIAPIDTNIAGSFGIFAPSYEGVSNDTVAIWASSSGLIDDTTVSTYGYATKYSDNNTNKQKSNFYVTYGGKLHATSAEIAGKITAKSGRIGVNEDNNWIEIAYTDENNKKYLLYNKNFWVGQINQTDDSNNSFGAFLKGRLMANSGMFGHIDPNQYGIYPDGNDSRTMFIQYKWYRWQLPGSDEPWDNEHMYLDIDGGRIVTYPLYHKNFWVNSTGTAFFNGQLFTKNGRIGGWVINDYGIKSVNGNLWLYSSNNDPSQVGLHLGAFHAYGTGAIGGTSWNISADGYASFTNPQNQFTGARFTVMGGGGAAGLVLDGTEGLWIPNNQRISIGGYSFSQPSGEIGVVSNGLQMKASYVAIGGSSQSGVVTPSYFSGPMYLGSYASNNYSLVLNPNVNGNSQIRLLKNGEYWIKDTGDALLKEVRVDDLYIDNQSVKEYIRQCVEQLFNANLPRTIVTGLQYGSTPLVRLNPQSGSYYGSGIDRITVTTAPVPDHPQYPSE